MKLAILLYQTGIANVFTVDRFNGEINPKRVMQGTFKTCEDFARGMIVAGITVRVMSVNVAGDASLHLSLWRDGLSETPFRDSANPPVTHPYKWPSIEYNENGTLKVITNELDGKRIAYHSATEFHIEVGKGRGKYKLRQIVTGNLSQAVAQYNCINIGNGYKKRLIMPSSSKNPVLAKQVS